MKAIDWPAVVAAVCKFFHLSPSYVLYELPFTTFVLITRSLGEKDITDTEEILDMFARSGAIIGVARNG